MTTEKKSLPPFVWFLGVVRHIYFDCTKSTRRNFSKLGKALLFTVSVCGTILAASFCEFWLGRNYTYLPLVFIGSALFYYILDQSIIMGDRHRGREGYRMMRILIALVLGLFNSFLIDYYFFKDDIIAARQSAIAHEQQAIQDRYDLQISNKEERKTALLGDVDHMQMRLSTQLDSLNAEANGFGGSRRRGVADVWHAKYKSYQADSLRFGALEQSKMQEVKMLVADIEQLKVKAEIEKSHVPETVSTGINKSLELLHQIIWLDGKFTNIFMSILILIVSMLLELIPLIAKDFFDVEEYFQMASGERELKMTIAGIEKQNNVSKRANTLMNEGALEMARLKSQTKIDQMKVELDFAKAATVETEQYMNEFEQKDKRWQEQYPHLYSTYGKPVMEKVFHTLAASTQQVFD